jgi:hypothetical protein
MGRQVNFFAIADDYLEFLVFLEQSGFKALPAVIPTEVVDTEAPAGIAPTETTRTAEFTGPSYYIIPPSIAVAEAFYHEITGNPSDSRLASRVSPVIEVRPCEIEDGSVRNGRIYFNMESHIDLYEQGAKAYARCARFFQKWPRTTKYNFRVGPTTADRVARGETRLLHGGEQMYVET